MFFLASKIAFLIASPLNFITLLIIFSLIIGRWLKSVGRFFFRFAVFLFLLIGIFPIGHDALVFLETRFAKPDILPEKIDGIIVLGGALSADLSHIHDEPVFGKNANRLTSFIELARRYPEAKLVFSGGNGHPLYQDYKEADIARKFFESVGFDPQNVIFERESRNTYENVIFSQRVAERTPNETWILITSAFHMPRSVSIFRHHDWDIIPWPVGYRTDGTFHFYPRNFKVLSQYEFAHIALKEYMGSIVYTLTNKSDEFFPGPK